MRLIRRVRDDERGVALVTAITVTAILLALGLALLSIVDTQAEISATERTRDRGFNLAESVLTNQAFVLGRNWPTNAPTPTPATCSAVGAGFRDDLGSTADLGTATARLRKTINASYTDSAYSGASWQVNLCDDEDPDADGPIPGSTVWSEGVRSNPGWDQNRNKRMWVIAQSDLGGKKRSLVGLVLVRENPMIPSKYGLVSGGLTDDLGGTVNTLSTDALGGVLGGLLGTTPTVAADPTLTTPPVPPSGGIGLRCGATDIQLIPASTCVAGTIGALGALPAVNDLLTQGKITQFPTNTTATPANIEQLKAQAVAAGTIGPSAGSPSVTTNQQCEITGSPSASSIVFIDRVGASGDEYCVVNVFPGGVKYKALVIGSGKVILRGNNTPTGTPSSPVPPSEDPPQLNTFTGVVYALNRQRLAVADGGQGLEDVGREVVRIEQGAHVKGGVYADGKHAKVGIYPPPLSPVNIVTLRNSVCSSLQLLQRTACLLLGTVGGLLGAVGLDPLVNGILDQLNPRRANYGSAIVSDVNGINSLTAYGASGVIPGSFRDLSSR